MEFQHRRKLSICSSRYQEESGVWSSERHGQSVFFAAEGLDQLCKFVVIVIVADRDFLHWQVKITQTQLDKSILQGHESGAENGLPRQEADQSISKRREIERSRKVQRYKSGVMRSNSFPLIVLGRNNVDNLASVQFPLSTVHLLMP